MNTLSTLAKAVAGIAPTLATMLGGPFAGQAVTALEGAFGLSPGTGADGITNAMQGAGMTAEIAARVRAADQEHEAKMKELGVDLAKINAAHEEAFAKVDADDRDSARKREMAVRDWTPRLLALVIVLCVGAAEGTLLFHGHVDGIDDIVLGRILGTLDSALMLVLSYYYGSSAGSRIKDETAQIVAKQGG